MNKLGSTRVDPADLRRGRLPWDRRTLAISGAAMLLLAAGGAAFAFIRMEQPAPSAVTSIPGPIPIKAPKPVPALEFETASGERLDLGAFRGKFVLLNVWATWCAPCRAEMPTLDRLQAALGGADFEVVALSIDRKGHAVVEEFYSKVGVTNLRTYLDRSGAAMRTLAIVGVPTTLLIDREGREIGRLAGPAEWDSPEFVTQLQQHLTPTSQGTARQTAPPV